MRLASARLTHFPESDARNIVIANLRHLFVHIRSADKSVRSQAHHVLMNYGLGGLPFVQQLIAEELLGLMGDLLPESAEISKKASLEAQRCSRHLYCIVRALTKCQRQKWVSMLVRVLKSQQAFHSSLIDDLQLLWRADDDPRRSYAEAERQLKAFSVHASQAVQDELCRLRCF